MAVSRPRLAAQFYLDRVSVEVRKLQQEQYPGDHPGPVLWLQLTQGLLDTANEYLDESRKEGTDVDKATQLIQDANEITDKAYSDCLNFMSGANIDDLPYSVVAPMQRWFDSLGVENAILFRSAHVANYEIVPEFGDMFRRYRNKKDSINKSDSLKKAIKAVKIWPFLRVTVPSRSLSILPHFSIVAHEVGHAILKRLKINLDSQTKPNAELHSRICSHLPNSSLSIADEVKRSEILQAWKEEFTADAIALVMTGPAAFFALCEFIQLQTSDYGMSETHPPTVLRREALHGQLTKGTNSFAAKFEKHTDVRLRVDLNSSLLKPLPSSEDLFKELFDALTRIYGKKTQVIEVRTHSAILTELIPYFREVSDEIFLQVENYFDKNHPKLRYTPEKFDQNLEDHLKPLLAAIPPIEAGKKLNQKHPADFTEILNIGWVILLTKLNELNINTDKTAKGTTLKAEVLHGLLLKAVELSEARRMWEEAEN